MGNNLIHNYLSNQTNAQPQKQTPKSGKSYFQMPNVSATMDSFDIETDKLVKPLDGKGHLVNNSLLHAPKEFIRDSVYTTKALADGARGKANDHQLGKLNDLGLKIGGLAIATYLMTKKSTPKTKAMEFVGFGAFLASMALWPKIALEIPARIIHGFNYRKQYIDDQGRKKEVGLDPNYMPFDLYKGDKKSENLDVIGDRLGIRRDMPNRHEAIQDNMRKICVQNNTMWMLTAGIATPIMTALACNQAEKFITPLAEKYSNKKVNESIDNVSAYLSGTLNSDDKLKYEQNVLKIKPAKDKTLKPGPITEMLGHLKGKIIQREDVVALADTLAAGFDAEMKDAAREDITNLIGGERYLANASSAENLANSIHSTILAQDAELAAKLPAEKLQKAASEGIIRGAVRDMLTTVGIDIVDKTGFNTVATNFKCKELDTIEFFAETEATKGMSPVDRLAHNIQSIVMKVNNSNPSEDFIPGMSDLERSDKGLKGQIDARLKAESEAIAKSFYEGNLAISDGREEYVRESISKLFTENAQRGPKHKKIYASVSKLIKTSEANRGYVLSDNVAETLTETAEHLRRYRAVDEVLTKGAHFKVEKANETIVANNWEKVTNVLVKELGITDKEISTASKNKNLTQELIRTKLEQACATTEGRTKLLESLAQAMVELDEKIDSPNEGQTGRMMDKIETGIKTNCTEAGNALERHGFREMKQKMVGSRSSALDGIEVGSLKNSKVERLHSRIEGVHSSYMRLLQTIDFFGRASQYEQEIANGADVASIHKKYGFTDNAETNKELIKRGKDMLLDAHTNQFYNKLGVHNNKDFFKTLMWSVFRPNNAEGWDQAWASATEESITTLNNVKVNGETPRRVFEGTDRKALGQKLKEHMNQLYNSFGTIKRAIIEGSEHIVTDGGVGASDARASKRFDLLGKAPSELLFDTLKQKNNSKQWMKVFAPILAATFGVTVGAQFFFGKKDPDIKA
ncbi:MAG: hypothetical protein NC200_01220 [Candidatus Gastranaerophilales bacterium]|nr:hypothetical protein [Candidatus Gastranaerophilales bacterium]